MAAKRMDLNVRTLLVLSGSSNPLGQSLAQELCARLAAGSVALLLDENHEKLLELEQHLTRELASQQVQIFTGLHAQQLQQFEEIVSNYSSAGFQRTIIVHNEGDAATHVLLEPQTTEAWTEYVQRQLNAPVALNQRWLLAPLLANVEKVVINVTSSLQVRPLVYNTLLCSCKKARDMYFRAMASEEGRRNVHVLSYAPGILKSHETQYDLNGNIVDPDELFTGQAQAQAQGQEGEDVLEQVEKAPAVPRVLPLQSTLKLINILEDIAFVSGHDVDYYDTFVL